MLCGYEVGVRQMMHVCLGCGYVCEEKGMGKVVVGWVCVGVVVGGCLGGEWRCAWGSLWGELVGEE